MHRRRTRVRAVQTETGFSWVWTGPQRLARKARFALQALDEIHVVSACAARAHAHAASTHVGNAARLTQGCDQTRTKHQHALDHMWSQLMVLVWCWCWSGITIASECGRVAAKRGDTAANPAQWRKASRDARGASPPPCCRACGGHRFGRMLARFPSSCRNRLLFQCCYRSDSASYGSPVTS